MRTPTLTIASAAFVAALLPGPSWAQNCTPDARRVVDAIYRQVLERNANGEGGTAVSQLANGQTSVRELVRNIAQSPEHIKRFMTGSHIDDATFAYRHLLGREPDRAGLEGYTRALQTLPPSAIIDDIMSSAEYQQNFGDDVVPGSRLRYCGTASSTSRMRFPNMDRNGDGQIERGEWNGNRGSFDVHDWNGDGVLSGDEVRVGGQRSARTAVNDFDPARADSWTTRNFRLLDRNRDNRIAANEWTYQAVYFRRADRDRDGVLSSVEFNDAGEVDDQFTSLDLNRNGRVDAREWTGSVASFQARDRNNDNWLSRAEVEADAEDPPLDDFQTLDDNRNNWLEAGEWQWSLRSFNRYDTNGDGRVSRQEFAAGGGAPAAFR